MSAALAFPWPNVAKQHHTCALPSPSFGVPSPSGTQAVGGPLRQTEVYSLSNAATWDSSSARLVAVHDLLKVRGGLIQHGVFQHCGYAYADGYGDDDDDNEYHDDDDDGNGDEDHNDYGDDYGDGDGLMTMFVMIVMTMYFKSSN